VKHNWETNLAKVEIAAAKNTATRASRVDSGLEMFMRVGIGRRMIATSLTIVKMFVE
jgi:hypothetical protein